MVSLILNMSMALVSGAILLSLYRLAVGPTLIDRVVALDVLTIVAIILIVDFAYLSGRSIYIDVALTYGLLSFMSVLAVARYMERGL